MSDRQKTKNLFSLFATLFLILFSSELLAATPIENTQTQSGSIVAPGQEDIYTFSGNSGDSVTILMAASGSSTDPQILLHGPDGSVLISAQTQGDSVTISAYVLPSGGLYSIVCRSWDGDHTWAYGVSLFISGQPLVLTPDVDGGPIANTQTGMGTVGLGDLDVWTFDGEAGDSVTILMAASGILHDPQVELHGPDGSVLTSVHSDGDSVTISAYVLPSGGLYSIVCRSWDGDHTLAYGVSLFISGQPLVLTPDTDGGFIADSETKSGAIDPYGDLDAWRFSACPDDSVTILMAASGSLTDPQVILHGPDGSVLTSAQSYGDSATISAYVLPSSGLYSIVCRSWGGDHTWAYDISLSLSGSSTVPYLASSPFPEDGAVDVPTDTNLSWVGGGPDPEGIVYDLSFGTSASPPSVATDLTNTTFDPGTLTSGTTYYWKVISRNNCYTVEGPLWQFNTPIVGNISGQIGTDITGQDTSIVGATITILETGQTAITDENGNYLLSSVPVGDNYTIAVSKKYFTTALVKGVSVIQDQTTPIALQQMGVVDCDMAADGKIGLKEAINALQTAAGIRSE